MKKLRVGLLVLMASLFLSPVQAQETSTSDTTRGHHFLVFSRVEREASFPGGNDAWKKYMQEVYQANKDSLNKKDHGPCVVRFIVHTSGDVSQVKAISRQGTRLAKVAVAAIQNGPKWIPARQNGKPVNAYREQVVRFRFSK